MAAARALRRQRAPTTWANHSTDLLSPLSNYPALCLNIRSPAARATPSPSTSNRLSTPPPELRPRRETPPIALTGGHAAKGVRDNGTHAVLDWGGCRDAECFAAHDPSLGTALPGPHTAAERGAAAKVQPGGHRHAAAGQEVRDQVRRFAEGCRQGCAGRARRSGGGCSGRPEA